MINLDAIKGRLAAAAPGPWTTMVVRRSIDGDCVALVQAEAPNCIVATIIPQYSERETIPLLVAARADMDALVAEVEHLRAAIAALQASVPPTHPSDYGHEVWAAAGHEAVAEERAAVVAHLRERAIHGVGITISIEDACTILADKIERGEHRREEEP